MSISRSWVSVSSIGRSLHSTGGHLHGLRVLFIGDLCSGARSSDILPLIHIGTDLSLYHSVGLLTDGQDSVEAVIVIHHLLHGQSDGSHLLRKGGHTHLSIDRGVCVPAQQLGGRRVTIAVKTPGQGKERRKEKQDQHH